MPEANLLSSNEEELKQLAISLAGQYKQGSPVQEQASPQLDTQLRERAKALAQQYHSTRTDVRPLGKGLYAEVPPPEVVERMEKVEEEAYIPVPKEPTLPTEEPIAEELRIEIPPPEVTERMKQVELSAWKGEQEIKARRDLRRLYEAGYQFADSASLGLLKRILEKEEDMPPDVVRDIVGNIAHFGGFLVGPVKIGKAVAKPAVSLLSKIVKNPKVLSWLKYGLSGPLALGTAFTVSDIADLKEAHKRFGSGAAFGAIFGGTALASFPKHPIVSQMIRQVGTRTLSNIFKLYEPNVARWNKLTNEQKAQTVWDELLMTWFSAKGVRPAQIIAKGKALEARIKEETPPAMPEPIPREYPPERIKPIPKTIPEEPIIPEMEIRVSKDPTTGEAIIKIPKTMPEAVPPSPFVIKEVSGIGKVQFPKDVVAYWPEVVPRLWKEIYDVTGGRMVGPIKGEKAEWQAIPRQLRRKEGMPLDEVADGLRMDSEALRAELIGARPIPSEKELREMEAERAEVEFKEYRETEAEAARLEREVIERKPIPRDFVVANIGVDGKIYYGKPGELHVNLDEQYSAKIRKEMGLEPGEYTWKKVGFARPGGKVLSREEALKITKVKPTVTPTELDALDYFERKPEIPGEKVMRLRKRVAEKEEVEIPVVEEKPAWLTKSIDNKLPDWFKEWRLDPEKHGEMYERVVENFKPRGGDLKEELKAYVMGSREYISRETGLAKKPPKEERLREEIVTEKGKIFREPAEEVAVLKPRERRPTPEEIYERKVIKPSPTKEEAVRKYVDKIKVDLSDSEKTALDSIMLGRSLRKGAKELGISHEQHRKDIIKLKEKMRIDPEFRRIAGEREIEIDEELAVKYEKAIEVTPEKAEEIPFDGVTREDAIKLLEAPTKEISKKARRVTTMLRDVLESQKFHKPNTLRNEFEKAGLDFPDELSYRSEQIYADKILSKARGYVDKYIKRMRADGVREEIIESTKVAGRYPVTKLVKIKREPKTGEISAVISKSLIEYVKGSYKGEGAEQFVKRFSAKHLKKQIERGLNIFKVPQYFFDGLGLKEIIYDPIRVGERSAEILRRSLRQEVKSIFKSLSKKERQQIFHFMAAKQGKTRDMKEAGIEPPKLSALNTEQKKSIVRWRELNKRYRKRVLELSRNHGVELKLVDNYFPLYIKNDLVLIGGEGTYLEAIRKDPFFRSILPRKEKVPYNLYEYDAYKNALAFSHGLANFLEIGRKTLPVKYLIDSREFKEIVSPDVRKDVVDWYKSIVNPQRSSEFWKFFRRAGYRTFLGLNPIVTAKQGISYLDVAIIEKSPGFIPPRIKQIISRLEKPSVTERLPEIAVADITTKADRALLAGVIYADRLFARMGLSRVLSAELMAMEKEGIRLDNKSLRKALNRVSDRIDLAMSGVTRAQRPPAFRTELGKMVLMFNSTINSRLQYYIKNMRGVKGAKPEDLFRIAKIGTAFLFGGYIEASLSNLALNWADRKEMLKDILKAAAGNVPVVGGLIFAVDTGNWSPSAVFSNIENGLKMISQWSKERVTPERMLLSLAEVVGLPKQVRKTYEGLITIKEGKRVAGKKVIEISEPIEQFRAILRGQYGPQKVKEFYRLRALKIDYNRAIAKKIAGIKDERLRSWLKDTKLSYFKRNFTAIIKRRLPESERNEIIKMIKEAEKRGIKISHQSILYRVREYLD